MLLEDLYEIINKWRFLKYGILKYWEIDPEKVKKGLSELIYDINKFISNNKNDLLNVGLLDEAQKLLQNVQSLISFLNAVARYGGAPPEELNLRLSKVDTSLNRLLNLVLERTENKGKMLIKKSIKPISKLPHFLFKREETETVTQKEEAKEEKTEESKEEKPEKRSSKIIRKIFIAPTIVFAFLSVYYLYLYNALYFIIFSLLASIFYSVYKGKISSSFKWIPLIVLVGGIMYIWTNTAFAQYICLTTGYCPGASLGPKPDENYIAQIKESVSKVIKDMYMIMTNPEMYYLQQQAEAEALPESYRYFLEITTPYYTAPVTYFPDENKVNISEFVLLYSIRGSLPADVGAIGITEYCIIVPKIDTSCIDPDSLANKFIANVSLDYKGRVRGYINLKKDDILYVYSHQHVNCTIPDFTLRLDICGDLRYNRFYIDNKFILRLTNITTITYYKFLVTDVSLVVRAMKNNKNAYDYLKLNPYEYDKGYFKGFIGFPKVDILRVGVISKYPVIVFNKSEKIQDAIYISLSNIEEMYNISRIKIDIIYNPNELNITTDYDVKSSFYNLTCNNLENGRLSCDITFGYHPGILDENMYLSIYKQELDRIIWFIPINIEVRNSFSEYSEVFVIANVTYGLQKEVTNSVSYVPMLTQTNT